MAISAITHALTAWAEETQGQGSCAILVRHGATEWNVGRRLQGQTDVLLSTLGIIQSQEAAAAIAAAASPTIIYTSPLKRAHVTAEVIGQAVHARVVVHHNLIERSFGILEGLTAEQANTRYPHRFDDEGSVPGLEPLDQVKDRAISTMTHLFTTLPQGLFVLVSHGAFLNAFLAVISHGKAGTGITNLANGGLSVVWRVGSTWRIGALNVVEHLSQPTGQSLPSPNPPLSGLSKCQEGYRPS